jgi:methionyl-tRNA synthetase
MDDDAMNFNVSLPPGAWKAPEVNLIKELNTRIRAYENFMEAMEIRKSAAELRAIWGAGNEYLQTAAPWSTFKEDPEQAAAQIRLALNLIRIYAVLSSPFIPDAAQNLMGAMKTIDNSWPTDVEKALQSLATGHAFSVPEVTFRKITNDERDEWKTQFGGQ